MSDEGVRKYELVIGSETRFNTIVTPQYRTHYEAQ